MKMTGHGKLDSFKVGFTVEHCHLRATLSFELAPEGLLTVTPVGQDSSERMNAICMRSTQAVAAQICEQVALMHLAFLSAVERTEIVV